MLSVVYTSDLLQRRDAELELCRFGKRTSATSELLVLLMRNVVAAPTTVAATAIEAAVSGSPHTTFSVPLLRVFAL